MPPFLAAAIRMVSAGSSRPRHAEGRHAGPDSGLRLPELPVDRRPLVSRPTVSSLSSFSIAQLCWLWRISGVRLRARTGRREAERLARVREYCLIELHQRDPEAFRHWVMTARAAENPTPFFRGRIEPEPA